MSACRPSTGQAIPLSALRAAFMRCPGHGLAHLNPIVGRPDPDPDPTHIEGGRGVRIRSRSPFLIPATVPEISAQGEPFPGFTFAWRENARNRLLTL